MRFASHGPADHPGAAGLVPVPARNAGSFQSWGEVDGSPGTLGIPAPRPAAVPQSWNRALHRSSDAPDVWFPGIYFQRGPASRAAVSVLSDNQMPVPAGDPRGRPAVMLARPVFLRQRQVRTPHVSISFRNRSGG